MLIAISFIVFLIFLLLLILIIFLSKGLIIQLKKNEIYEQWIREFQDRVESVQKTMIELDDKQMFSKDDEVSRTTILLRQ